MKLGLALLFGNVLLAPLTFATELRMDAVVTLTEEIHVPAREAGVLSELSVRPGSKVVAGRIIGRLDETRVRLVRDQARLELENASRLAGNDLKLKLARKAHEVATAELKRAVNAAEQFEKSVSQTELDRLRLEAERAGLQIDQERFDFETAQLSVVAKETALRIAEHDVARRAIVTPVSGIVVERLKQTGEWVESGEAIVRVVRMDRLRVEGFLPAKDALPALVGRAVSVSIDLGDEEPVEIEGTMTFVSPEIHPVNNMVRVWAEVENHDALLRPGLQANMTIRE